MSSDQGKSLTTALLIICSVAFMIGLLGIASASSLKGQELTGDPLFFVRKQALFGCIAGLLIFILYRIPLRWIERVTLPLLIATFTLLALVFVPGMYAKVGGAARWLQIGPIRFQPAELCKLSLLLFLAKNLSRSSLNIRSFRQGVAPNLMVGIAMAGLLMAQPDFGTSVVLILVTMMMLFVAGISYKNLSILLGLGLTAGVAAVLAAPYRMQRILTFLNPWDKIQTGGFQIIQSYVGFQNGGLMGRGLGESKQKLFFLPEAHTDFILSVIGEELGLIGVTVVILSLFAITSIAYRIALQQDASFRRFLALGIAATFAIQSLINIAVTMGMLPTKGISLPLISSGASSLISFGIMIGLLARMSRMERKKKKADHLMAGQQPVSTAVAT